MLDNAANRSGTGVAVFARQSGLIGSAATASAAASTTPAAGRLGLVLRSNRRGLRHQRRCARSRASQETAAINRVSSWISTWFIDPFRLVIILIKYTPARIRL